MASLPLQNAGNTYALQHGEEGIAACNVEEWQQIVACFQQLALHIAHAKAAGHALPAHGHGRKRSGYLTYLHHYGLQT